MSLQYRTRSPQPQDDDLEDDTTFLWTRILDQIHIQA
jgi:hypothetical protein